MACFFLFFILPYLGDFLIHEVIFKVHILDLLYQRPFNVLNLLRNVIYALVGLTFEMVEFLVDLIYLGN